MIDYLFNLFYYRERQKLKRGEMIMRKLWQILGLSSLIIWIFIGVKYELEFLSNLLILIKEVTNLVDLFFYSLVGVGFLTGPALVSIYLFNAIFRVEKDLERVNLAMIGVYTILMSFLIGINIRIEWGDEFLIWPNYILVFGIFVFLEDSYYVFRNMDPLDTKDELDLFLENMRKS